MHSQLESLAQHMPFVMAYRQKPTEIDREVNLLLKSEHRLVTHGRFVQDGIGKEGSVSSPQNDCCRDDNANRARRDACCKQTM